MTTPGADQTYPAVVRLSTNVRRVLPLAVGCAIFTALGVWFLFDDSTVRVVIGIVAIVFFGGFGGFAIIRMLRGRAALELSPSGIRMSNGRSIPWQSIALVGEFRQPRAAVAITLSTPTDLLSRGQKFTRSANGGVDYIFPAALFAAPTSDVVMTIVNYGRALTGSPSWPYADPTS